MFNEYKAAVRGLPDAAAAASSCAALPEGNLGGRGAGGRGAGPGGGGGGGMQGGAGGGLSLSLPPSQTIQKSIRPGEVKMYHVICRSS